MTARKTCRVAGWAQQAGWRGGRLAGRALWLAGMLLFASWHGVPVMASEAGQDGEQAAASAVAPHDAVAGAAENGGKQRKLLTPRFPPDVRRDDQKYCYQIADEARDARYARQKRQLADMQKRLQALLKELERKRREYQQWVARREAITARMTRAMLDVYAKMEPDAAARQIEQMEYAVAVAILTGLKPQQASAILTEMKPKDAGRLVNVIVGAVAEGGLKSAGETN